MYIEQDLVKPAVMDLAANRKLRNRILRYWPKESINGVTVLSNLYLYAGGSVQQSASHKKIYNLLGIKIGDLTSNSWKGIENYYVYFNPEQGTYDNLTSSEVETFIMFEAPFTKKVLESDLEPNVSEWITAELSYEPLKVASLDNALSDSQIILKSIADPYILEYSIEDEPLLTAFALLDYNNVMFDREFKILYRNLSDVTFTAQTSSTNKATFIKEVTIEFRFRRKVPTNTVTKDSYIASLISAMYASVNGKICSVNTQLHSAYHSMVPLIDSAILYNNRYRLDGLQGMKAKEFNSRITARMRTGYTKKKVKKWKKLITIVIAIIIIIVSILTYNAQGLAAAATVLTAGTLAMQALAIIVAKHDPAWAAYIGKVATTLGYIATAVSLVNIANQLAVKAGGEGLKEAAKEALKEQGKEVTAEAVKQQMASMAAEYIISNGLQDISFDAMQDMLIEYVKGSTSTTLETMTTVLNWTTKAFQFYVATVNPPDDGLDAMTRKVKEQEQQLEDLTNAGLKDKIDYTFSSPFYNIYDFNEVIQAIPYKMTQGRVDSALSKYYDAVSSKTEYRGYLG